MTHLGYDVALFHRLPFPDQHLRSVSVEGVYRCVFPFLVVTNEHGLPEEVQTGTKRNLVIRPGSNDRAVADSQDGDPHRILDVDAMMPQIMPSIVSAEWVIGAAPGGVRFSKRSGEPEVILSPERIR